MAYQNPKNKPAKTKSEPDLQLPAELDLDLNPTQEEIFRKLNPTQRKVFTELLISQSVSFRGPIPPPELLKEYNEIIPNGADRILIMAENQSTHRQSMEKTVIASQTKMAEYGQYFGFIIAIIGLGSCIYLALNGATAVASIIGGGTVIGLAGLFITGQYNQNKDLKKKE